jgi:hypothetical protein
MQQWQCTVKCRRRDVVHTHCVTLFCCVKVSSRHDAWRMERDSFALSFDQTMTWSRAYHMGVLDARCFRYDIENGALHLGWYTEMPPSETLLTSAA